jgi:hypothetical protein
LLAIVLQPRAPVNDLVGRETARRPSLCAAAAAEPESRSVAYTENANRF